MKADERSKSIPVMLVTNYEEHQQAAIELERSRGFGKLSVKAPATIDLLAYTYIGRLRLLITEDVVGNTIGLKIQSSPLESRLSGPERGDNSEILIFSFKTLPGLFVRPILRHWED